MPRSIRPELVKLIDKKLSSNGLAQLAIEKKDARAVMMFAAESCVGEKESGGNNKGSFVELCQKTVDGSAVSEPWCMAFDQSMIAYAEVKTGVKSEIFSSEHCLTVWRKSPIKLRVKRYPGWGAMAIWQNGDSEAGHTGFVSSYEGQNAKSMETVEGNTGKLFSDGDGVFAKTRNTKADGKMKVVGFLIPFEKQEEKIEPVVVNRFVGSWEKSKPELIPSTDKLASIIQLDLPKYEAASDIKKLNSNFARLTTQQKVYTILEFWIAVAKFESSWNPKSFAVDVGTKSDLGSYSVGLYQMSANDGAAKVYKATFETLKNPLVNIDVALEQMRRQLKNTNTIFLPNSSKYRYWAVMLMNNKYSKINEILALVKKNTGF